MTKAPMDWPRRLDRWAACCGAMVPVGLVVGNAGFETMVALTGLIWIVRSALTRENPLPFLVRHPLALPWMAWYAVMVVSLAVNGPGSKGWAHDVVFIRYVLFGLALVEISRRFPVGRYLVWGVGAGVAWAALNTASAYILGHDLIGKPLVRYTGKLKEASRIAGLSAYGAPFFLTWAVLDVRARPKQRLILALIGSVAFVQVFQTQVRTAILAACAGMVVALAVIVRRRVSVKAAAVLVVALAIMLTALFQHQRMRSLSSIYDRIYYWKVAWAMFQDHPALGVGISSFQDTYKEMAASGTVAPFEAPDGLIRNEGVQTHAHSLLFMLLACTGLAGVAAFGWLFVQAMRNLARTAQGWRVGLASWPVVVLTVGLTGFNIYHSWYQALLAVYLVLIGVQTVNGEAQGHG